MFFWPRGGVSFSSEKPQATWGILQRFDVRPSSRMYGLLDPPHTTRGSPVFKVSQPVRTRPPGIPDCDGYLSFHTRASDDPPPSETKRPNHLGGEAKMEFQKQASEPILAMQSPPSSSSLSPSKKAWIATFHPKKCGLPLFFRGGAHLFIGEFGLVPDLFFLKGVAGPPCPQDGELD